MRKRDDDNLVVGFHVGQSLVEHVVVDEVVETSSDSRHTVLLQLAIAEVVDFQDVKAFLVVQVEGISHFAKGVPSRLGYIAGLVNLRIDIGLVDLHCLLNVEIVECVNEPMFRVEDFDAVCPDLNVVVLVLVKLLIRRVELFENFILRRQFLRLPFSLIYLSLEFEDVRSVRDCEDVLYHLLIILDISIFADWEQLRLAL